VDETQRIGIPRATRCPHQPRDDVARRYGRHTLDESRLPTIGDPFDRILEKERQQVAAGI